MGSVRVGIRGPGGADLGMVQGRGLEAAGRGSGRVRAVWGGAWFGVRPEGR